MKKLTWIPSTNKERHIAVEEDGTVYAIVHKVYDHYKIEYPENHFSDLKVAQAWAETTYEDVCDVK